MELTLDKSAKAGSCVQFLTICSEDQIGNSISFVDAQQAEVPELGADDGSCIETAQRDSDNVAN